MIKRKGLRLKAKASVADSACEELDTYLTETTSNVMDLDDTEAASIMEYQSIAQKVPKAFSPCTLLTDMFFEQLKEVLEFFGQQNPSHRHRLVASALQDHASVQTVLTDMSSTVVNRKVLETPLLQIIDVISTVRATLNTGLDKVEAAEVLKLADDTTAAIGCIQIVSTNIGGVFANTVEGEMQSITEDQSKDIIKLAKVKSKSDGQPLLQGASKLLAEANVMWPFSSFQDLQVEVGTLLRDLSATADLAKLVGLFKSFHEEDPDTASHTFATKIAQTMKLMDIHKLDDSVQEM